MGPLIGGLLTDGLGWEWIFFVNVPIGIAAIVLTETRLANVAATDGESVGAGRYQQGGCCSSFASKTCL